MGNLMDYMNTVYKDSTPTEVADVAKVEKFTGKDTLSDYADTLFNTEAQLNKFDDPNKAEVELGSNLVAKKDKDGNILFDSRNTDNDNYIGESETEKLNSNPYSFYSNKKAFNTINTYKANLVNEIDKVTSTKAGMEANGQDTTEIDNQLNILNKQLSNPSKFYSQTLASDLTDMGYNGFTDPKDIYNFAKQKIYNEEDRYAGYTSNLAKTFISRAKALGAEIVSAPVKAIGFGFDSIAKATGIVDDTTDSPIYDMLMDFANNSDYYTGVDNYYEQEGAETVSSAIDSLFKGNVKDFAYKLSTVKGKALGQWLARSLPDMALFMLTDGTSSLVSHGAVALMGLGNANVIIDGWENKTGRKMSADQEAMTYLLGVANSYIQKGGVEVLFDGAKASLIANGKEILDIGNAMTKDSIITTAFLKTAQATGKLGVGAVTEAIPEGIDGMFSTVASNYGIESKDVNVLIGNHSKEIATQAVIGGIMGASLRSPDTAFTFANQMIKASGVKLAKNAIEKGSKLLTPQDILDIQKKGEKYKYNIEAAKKFRDHVEDKINNGEYKTIQDILDDPVLDTDYTQDILNEARDRINGAEEIISDIGKAESIEDLYAVATSGDTVGLVSDIANGDKIETPNGYTGNLDGKEKPEGHYHNILRKALDSILGDHENRVTILEKSKTVDAINKLDPTVVNGIKEGRKKAYKELSDEDKASMSEEDYVNKSELSKEDKSYVSLPNKTKLRDNSPEALQDVKEALKENIRDRYLDDSPEATTKLLNLVRAKLNQAVAEAKITHGAFNTKEYTLKVLGNVGKKALELAPKDVQEQLDKLKRMLVEEGKTVEEAIKKLPSSAIRGVLWDLLSGKTTDKVKDGISQFSDEQVKQLDSYLVNNGFDKAHNFLVEVKEARIKVKQEWADFNEQDDYFVSRKDKLMKWIDSLNLDEVEGGSEALSHIRAAYEQAKMRKFLSHKRVQGMLKALVSLYNDREKNIKSIEQLLENAQSKLEDLSDKADNYIENIDKNTVKAEIKKQEEVVLYYKDLLNSYNNLDELNSKIDELLTKDYDTGYFKKGGKGYATLEYIIAHSPYSVLSLPPELSSLFLSNSKVGDGVNAKLEISEDVQKSLSNLRTTIATLSESNPKLAQELKNKMNIGGSHYNIRTILTGLGYDNVGLGKEVTEVDKLVTKVNTVYANSYDKDINGNPYPNDLDPQNRYLYDLHIFNSITEQDTYNNAYKVLKDRRGIATKDVSNEHEKNLLSLSLFAPIEQLHTLEQDVNKVKTVTELTLEGSDLTIEDSATTVGDFKKLQDTINTMFKSENPKEALDKLIKTFEGC